MKVLWITNILLPEALELLGVHNELKGSGGWLVGAIRDLQRIGPISLSIAAPTNLVSDLRVLKGESITYYAIPRSKKLDHYDVKFESYWKTIQQMVMPDVVHIHGTEFPHGLTYVKACGNNNVVASIQGMTSRICRYNTLGVPVAAQIKNTTLVDLCLRQTLWDDRRFLYKSGQSEINLIKNINHIIGRTTWDRANTWAINSHAQYHFCNETLRPEFYSGCWVNGQCRPHSIFVSQAKNSVKGFHQLLKALPIVLAHFPDTVVRVPGSLQLYPRSLKGKVLQTGYNRYLKSLVDEYELKKHIVFLGSLTAEEMKKEYLSANVFVSCSSIENSSNSIGEAQILGTPCISSYVGGSGDLITDGVSGFLYRYEEVEMLAYYICGVFNGDYDINRISQNEIAAARCRHDSMANAKALYDIYNMVIGSCK